MVALDCKRYQRAQVNVQQWSDADYWEIAKVKVDGDAKGDDAAQIDSVLRHVLKHCKLAVVCAVARAHQMQIREFCPETALNRWRPSDVIAGITTTMFRMPAAWRSAIRIATSV